MLLPLMLLAIGASQVTAFYWKMASSVSNYPPNMVYFESIYQGNQAVCRNMNYGASGRIYENKCYIGYGGKEYIRDFPFEVFHYEPLTEKPKWDYRPSQSHMQNNGVLVNSDSNGSTWVCAHYPYGPGKYSPHVGQHCWYSFKGNEIRESTYSGLILDKSNDYDMSNVRYDLDNVNEISEKPTYGVTQYAVNYDYSTTLTITETVDITMRQTDYWDVSESFYLSTYMKIKAAVPTWGFSAKWETTAEYNYETNYGQTCETEFRKTSSVAVPVPPRTRCPVYMYGKQKTIGVPFTANMVTRWSNGASESGSISGVYDGFPVIESYSILGTCESLDGLGTTAVQPELTVLSTHEDTSSRSCSSNRPF